MVSTLNQPQNCPTIGVHLSVIATLRYLNNKVEIDIDPDNTIDTDYAWEKDDKNNKNSGGVFIESTGGPAILGGNPKG